MRFFFILLGILFSFSFYWVSAETWELSLSHSKKLQKILELDSRVMDKISKIQRNNLLQGVFKDIEMLRYTWRLKPTFDTTLRYMPYLQKYSLSCEIAALAMVLSSLWSPQTEDELIAKIPHFPEVYTGGIWWDPDKEFVGSITGSQRRWTGYGVYPYPLSEVVKNDFSTEIYSLSWRSDENDRVAKNKMSEYLLKIESGTHVILWWDWCTRKEYEDGILSGSKSHIIKFFPIAGKNECNRNDIERTMYWTTPAGVEVSWLSGEHAFILLGYIGKRNNPSHIIVWDTDTGRHIYLMNEWMRKWGMLEYRALTIRDYE